MREIKFRGKTKMTSEELEGFEHDNGWFYGNLVMYGKTPYIVGDFIEVDQEYTINEFWVPVYPESVGQHTGLKDKNGKEIYEGDFYKNPLGNNMKIIYTIHDSAFMGESLRTGEKFGLLNFNGYLNGEVIGNIYENPELLGGENSE